MREYLDKMDNAMWWGPELDGEPPMVLAALGPLMLKLAAERTLGAHPYFAPPENSRRSREIMGPDAWICPEQKVMLETDPERARERARAAMVGPLQMPNYRNNLMRCGFEESALDDGGSDEVVDAVVAWGDESARRWSGCANTSTPAPPMCASNRSTPWTRPVPAWRPLKPWPPY